MILSHFFSLLFQEVLENYSNIVSGLMLFFIPFFLFVLLSKLFSWFYLQTLFWSFNLFYCFNLIFSLRESFPFIASCSYFMEGISFLISLRKITMCLFECSFDQVIFCTLSNYFILFKFLVWSLVFIFETFLKCLRIPYCPEWGFKLLTASPSYL